MAFTYATYLQRVKQAFSRGDGAQVAALLDVTGCLVQANQPASKKKRGGGGLETKLEHVSDLAQNTTQQLESKANKALRSQCGDSAAEVAASCAVCARHLLAGDPVQAYDRLALSVQPFVDLFRTEEQTWVVPPLHAMADNVRLVACSADDAIRSRGGEPDRLENAGNHLMTFFSAANRPQGDPDKRLATLRVVNSLFRIYFALNTLRNCKYLVRVVDAKKFLSFESFACADRVTYKFFVGRLAVYEEDFECADSYLTYAFDRCLGGREHRKQRSMILKYLVPVKILTRNQLPSEALLRKYALDQRYAEVCRAVREGAVAQFERALAKNMELFVASGVFLLMERLRQAVYRRLLKKVKLIHQAMRPEKAVQVPLRLYAAALTWQGYECTLDEVECICANQIYRGHVKGYVSHKSGILVLSKKEPFPPMSFE
ncbi:enhanced ethylene response protein 5 [Chloropicon roscoffensis]|uniref:Enhanced ethylene response protein 5 n=1 Tax=Chloropicon roscoffensis TaxID=1461544 RepID=A0AAX4PIY1_9CHLO|mmetsp:Transcript_12166/g.36949  ORF Transcript_12166/g.36949 Transcript_12166/m.36949 type:complete len:431 (-) Transcript_12166:71-1363(-)